MCSLAYPGAGSSRARLASAETFAALDVERVLAHRHRAGEGRQQRLAEAARLAGDGNAPVARAQLRRGVALDVGRADRLDRLDPCLQLGGRPVGDDQGADRIGQSRGRLDAAAEVADQRRLARGQPSTPTGCVIRRSISAASGSPPRRRLCLVWPRRAAALLRGALDAARDAVAEAALDADLLVQAR
jgi:hypothetical protein